MCASVRKLARTTSGVSTPPTSGSTSPRLGPYGDARGATKRASARRPKVVLASSSIFAPTLRPLPTPRRLPAERLSLRPRPPKLEPSSEPPLRLAGLGDAIP